MSAALVLPNVRANYAPPALGELTLVVPQPAVPQPAVLSAVQPQPSDHLTDQQAEQPADQPVDQIADQLDDQPAVAPPPQIAFYRKYTEGLLRRYLRCSMESGKVPSMLGKEMFRGKVSSYRMESFDDIIIFVCDVERCLGRLDEEQQQLIARIALQEYTILEISEEFRLNPKTVVRLYNEALDNLTRIFLAVEILHPQNDVKR